MAKSGLEQGEYVIGIAIILASLLVSATAYMSMNSLQKAIAAVKITSAQVAVGQQAAGQQAAQNQQAQAAQGTGSLAPTKEVTIDFLYADWCPHCQKMKPIVAALEAQLPSSRFAIRYWRDEDRQSDSKVAGVFDTYTQKGMFSGFPTFIINGADFKAGEMPEATFRSWICSKFKAPAPTGC